MLQFDSLLYIILPLFHGDFRTMMKFVFVPTFTDPLMEASMCPEYVMSSNYICDESDVWLLILRLNHQKLKGYLQCQKFCDFITTIGEKVI